MYDMDSMAVANKLILRFDGGVEVHAPLSASPRLLRASQSQLADWRIIGRGRGIRWEHLDEDISIEGLVQGNLTSVEIK